MTDEKLAWRTRLRRWGRFCLERYFDADPRTLGVYRILLGLLLCGDCLRHWYYARDYYSNEGLLTNHYHLYRPSSDFNFSLFHSFSTLGEVHVAFALSLLCYFFLLIGWRTRLFAVLSCIWVTSMDNRLVLVENGGYVVVNLMAFWGMFLPLGRRFSVDSLLRSMRERRETSVEQLADRTLPEKLTAPFRSLTVFLAVANFCIIYVFNVVNKYGTTWRRGVTVWYVLHIDRMATGVAVWLREHWPYWLAWGLSHLVLVVEACIVMLIAWPQGRRWSRPSAMVLIFGLHTAFGVCFRLGPFSWFMIAWSSLLIMAVHWDMLRDWYRRRAAAVTVTLRSDSATGFQLARLLTRLDRAELLTFESSDEGPWLTATREGRKSEGRQALLCIARALPLGRWALPLLRVLSLGLLDVMLAQLSARQAWVARFWGLQPPQAEGAPRADTEPEPSEVREWMDDWLVRLREAFMVFMTIALTSQILNDNKSIPKVLHHEQPFAIRAIMGYARIFQGWGMFAPNPVREDGYCTVDAVTIDGRRVDPFTGKEPDMDLTDARGLEAGQIVQDYFNRIRLDRNKVFRQQFSEWIQRYDKRTGNPNDQVVAFNVYWLIDQNPDPGSIEPFDHHAYCILSWRKPGYRPAPGLPPLPEQCQVVSGEPTERGEVKKDEKFTEN